MMVVKGTKNLKHCALLDPSSDSGQVDPWEEDVSAQVIKVTYQQGDLDIPHEPDNQNLKQYGDWAQNFNGSLRRPANRYRNSNKKQGTKLSKQQQGIFRNLTKKPANHHAGNNGSVIHNGVRDRRSNYVYNFGGNSCTYSFIGLVIVFFLYRHRTG